MQYVMGLLWVMYIVHALRRAFAEHCLARTLAHLWRRLSSIQPGMTPSEVRSAMGGPTRITTGAEMTIWQYRIDGEFKSIRFTGGQVLDSDGPPTQQAGEP